jgi:hypothetical protein
MDNETIQRLRELFETIRDERRTFANTANRIGNAFLELLYAIRNMAGSFLRKDQDDETNFFITFLKGVFFGNFTTGALGTGGAVTIDEHGNSSAEFDFLTIRKAATFRSITILELKHIGGELGITAGAMKVSRVEELNDAYRCYFETSDGKRRVYQEFIVGDQARCQAFRLRPDRNGMLRTKYYWRLVVGVSTGDNADEGYVDLSKTVCDAGSSVPEEGDEVIQLGYRPEANPLNEEHKERQSAIILSAVANDAPSQKFYQGINSFNLEDKFVKDEGYDPRTGLFHCNIYGDFFVGDKGADPANFVKYDSVNHTLEISGRVKMTSGSTLDGATLNNSDISQVINQIAGTASAAQTDASNALSEAQSAQQEAEAASDAANQASQDAQSASETASTADNNATQALNIANNLSTGNGNLLRNSGFTGDYLPESVAPTSEVDSGTPMYSDPFDHWGHENAEVVVSAESVTGSAAVLTNGSLQQTLEIGVEAGKPYVFSFKGKGTSLQFSVGGFSQTVALNNTVERYNVKFTAASSGTAFAITGSTCTVMELQLIEGNIPFNNWVNHPKDNDKLLAYFQNYNYLLDSIVNGKTQILGGLILSEIIKVGLYRNNQTLAENDETGGMSGHYNSDNSPFIWGGGSMTKAFYTIAKYTENPNYEPTAEELANDMAQFVVTHGGMAILNNIIARGAIFATSGVFKNITSPYGKFRIDNEGNMTVRDATISGNMYAPLFVINNANYEQCTRASSDPYNRYRYINLDVTGLNIQIDAEVFRNTLGISLPNDEKYNGAIVRISNNTGNRIPLFNSVVKANKAIGTLRTSNNESLHTNIESGTYVIMQCECFSAKTVCMGYSYKEFTKGSQMQKIADVQVGDELRIVGGIVYGDDGYKVCGGTSASPNNEVFWNTLQSQDVSYRVSGFETNYSVKASPACTAIYGNLDYDDTKAAVYVFKLNTETFYGWKNTNEHAYEGNYENPQYMRFYDAIHGQSVGSNPYIDENGILRFENWTRQATNGTIYQNG